MTMNEHLCVRAFKSSTAVEKLMCRFAILIECKQASVYSIYIYTIYIVSSNEWAFMGLKWEWHATCVWIINYQSFRASSTPFFTLFNFIYHSTWTSPPLTFFSFSPLLSLSRYGFEHVNYTFWLVRKKTSWQDFLFNIKGSQYFIKNIKH